MKRAPAIEHETYPDPHHDLYSRTTFGFWLYLLTDFILFGTLFGTYAVLKDSTFGGPSAQTLFNLPSVLIRTLILLISSLVVGLAGAAAHRRNKNLTLVLFSLTFVLGMIFMVMQMGEFNQLLDLGHHWQRSAFLSAYFTLTGTYALHMVFALLWVVVLIIPVYIQGVNGVSIRRLTCLKMFWQFLNIVWVFIFSFIYLLGAK